MSNVIKNDILHEIMYFKELKNGLEIYVLPKKGYSKQVAIYATKYGSNDISFIVPGEQKPTTVPCGIAHFLEHKLFEEEDGNIFDKYAKLGAHPNAFTNFNTTAYYFTCTDNFYESLDILVGFVGRPYFTDENVEKEKGIIKQEILMYEDDPNWKVFFNMLRALYKVHPVRNDIAGTVESIEEIDRELLYKCYNTFYHPSNMVLFVAGDVDKDRIFEIVEDKFDDSIKRQSEIKRIYPDEPRDVVKREIKQKMAVSRPLFAIGFKDTPLDIGGKKLLKRIIVNDIIADMFIGPSSNLYTELYEEGLVDDSFSSGYEGEKGYGHIVMSGETSDVETLLKKIKEAIKNIDDNTFDEERFLQIKKKKIGQYIRSFNYIENIAYMFVNFFVKEANLFDYIEVVEDIKYTDIQDQIYNIFDEDVMVVSVIEPLK
ncbi:MAG TPA: insulinase family protein [Clostridiales bacterium]|nr:insulinase family protein [Clostridiales bacterium]